MLKHHVSCEFDRFSFSLEPDGNRLVRLRRPGCGVAADMLAHRKADEQGLAACRTTPLRTVGIGDIRAAGRFRVQLLKRPLVAASDAVPGQLGHPGDLLWGCNTVRCNADSAAD